MLKKVAVALTLVAAFASAQAQSNHAFYAGADVGNTTVDGLDGADKLSYGIFGGYKFNDNVAAELNVRHMAKWNSVNLSQAGLSVLGIVPVSKEFSVYGRLGYNNLSASASSGNRTVTATTSGALYGVGVNFQVSKEVGIRAEYQRPASDTKNFSVGAHYSF